MYVIPYGHYMKIPKGTFKSAEDVNRMTVTKHICDWEYWAREYYQKRYEDNRNHDIYFYLSSEGGFSWTFVCDDAFKKKYKSMQTLGEL